MAPIEWTEKAREVMLNLVEDVREFKLKTMTFRSLMEALEVSSELMEQAEMIAENPPSVARERVGQELLPLIDFALEGLSHGDAQALLERVRKFRESLTRPQPN